MTKYLTEERFIVQSNDKESMKNYRDNYDRIFGKKDEEPQAPDTDAIECRVKFYANVVAPVATAVIKDVEPPCPLCGATDHERVEAFGGSLVGCPKVPDNTLVCVPPMAIVQEHNDNTAARCRNSLSTCSKTELSEHDCCYTCTALAETL